MSSHECVDEGEERNDVDFNKSPAIGRLKTPDVVTCSRDEHLSARH